MAAVLLIGMPGVGEWLIILLMLIIVGVTLLFPAIALFDILRNQFKNQSDKIIWVLVVLLLPVFGSILYYAIGRNQKLA
jgi:4-amino-4-deoxy-L-arabinose transferase-like glycosyltransferase